MSLIAEAPILEILQKEHSTQNEKETRKLAEAFAKLLVPGDVVALKGELGAGKTVVVKAIAKSLGYDGPVTSPSFTLLNVYITPQFPIYHFDFYRVTSETEAMGIGVDEFLQGEGISLIEWPEKIPNLLPEQYYEYSILMPDFSSNPTERRIRIREVQQELC